MDSDVDVDRSPPPSQSVSTPPPPLTVLERDNHKKSDANNLTAPEAGFEISVFCSPVIALKFRHGPPFTIHRALLLKSTKLAGLCDVTTTESVDLNHIPIGAGHVLVQYLYTTRYEGLQWTGAPPPPPDAAIGRFKTAVEVYAAAREYGLEGLEELAREQIESEGAGLHAFTIIDAVKEAYPTPTEDDIWFPNYIKSRIKRALEEPAALMSVPCRIDFGEPMSIAKVVFRGMLEVYCEMFESLAHGTRETPTHALEPLTAQPQVHDISVTPAEEPEEEPVVQTSDDSVPPESTGIEETSPTETRPEVLEAEHLPQDPLPLLEDQRIEHPVDLSVQDQHQPHEKENDQRVMTPPCPTPVLPPKLTSETQRLSTQFEVIPESKGPSDVLVDPNADHDGQSQLTTPSEPPEVDLSTPGLVPDVMSRSSEEPPTDVMSDRTTPSPVKDGGEFWSNLSRRRRERIASGRRTTVTFDIPSQEDLAGGCPGGGPDNTNKRSGKELSGTAPEFVPRSHILHGVGGLEPPPSSPFGPELTPLTVLQHQPRATASDRFMSPLQGDDDDEELEPATFYDVKEPFRQDLIVAPMFSPRSDPGIGDLPDLVPPDPNIWGPIGSHYSKPKNNNNKMNNGSLSAEQPAVGGAQLDREPDPVTPEPATPNDKWDSWGTRLSSGTGGLRTRKRTLSMSLSLNALTSTTAAATAAAADFKDSDAKPRPTMPGFLWSNLRSKERLAEPAVIDDSHGGACATPEPEPEPEPASGATLSQDDSSNNAWDQRSSSSPPPPPPSQDSSHTHPVPRKKRSKRSRRLRALAEEQGLALPETAAAGDGRAEAVSGGSDVQSQQNTADEREQRTNFEEKPPSRNSPTRRGGSGAGESSRVQAQSPSPPPPPLPQQPSSPLLAQERDSSNLGHGDGKQDPQREHDVWEFWGAKRSPTSRRSF